MARKRRNEGLDELLEEKADEFESGIERRQDSELDDMIWELGRYEDMEPLTTEAEEFKPENRVEEVPPEELLTEKVLENDLLVEKKELVVPTDLLRVELSGTDLEVACGDVPVLLRREVESYCAKRKISVGDIWYDARKMKQLWKSWNAWHYIDNIFHDIGLSGSTDDLNMTVALNYERVEDYDTALVKVNIDKVMLPPARRGRVPVMAGVVCDGKYSYEIDIAGDFDPGLLEFNFIDLSDFGVPGPLLTEVLYDGQAMYFEHEDFTTRDMLDVKFLESAGT